MKHRPRPEEQDDLLRPRLVDMIDPRHELVKLAALIDWELFEREWTGFFPSHKRRPAAEPRLVAGLLYLQQAYRLSDEAVVARWVENPNYQHFTGEAFFQHRPPIDPSSLTRLRGWIGEEGVEWLLTQTIQAGQKSGVIDEDSAKRLAVDTTVMEKNITYPTDARFYERARGQLAELAHEAGVDLRQSYARLAPRLAL
jgi:IS5 family transposase